MKNRLHSLQTLTRWLSNFRNVINRPQSILTRRADISKRAIWMLLVLLLLYLAIPLPNPLFPQDYSTVVLDRDGQILRAFLNRKEQWLLPPRPELPIPEKLKIAVLHYEDRYFYFHPGVNPAAVLRALSQNLAAGRTISGASTITMQVARLIRPKARHLGNKLLEMLQAAKLELRYRKGEILTFYLNHAPYGGNIVGYQAAALRYFRKLPEQLTWGEATTLAVLPNAPGLISPDSNPDLLKTKRDRLLTSLFREGVLDQESYELARMEPLPAGSHPFRMLAPHLGQWLKDQQAPAGGLLHTTVERQLQEQVEAILARHLKYLAYQGIANGAALVADTRSGEVLAYVGSQNFFDFATDGQVDGVQAPRSSGSLLKPFLYALAIDEGLLLPPTQIKDVPSYYGAFSPSNASETYDGIVTAKAALVRSLNVPATRLLYRYGIQPFYLFLQSNRLATLIRPASEYGLPLILGGAEVSVWEMARFFRGLGNGGRIEPLRVLQEPEEKASPRENGAVISPMACYLTLNMLRELQRPGAEYYWEQYQNQWPLAWKTGTSYGQRDAWAVGVSPQWTIAVWVGNFSGDGNANLAGAKCAGPLLFDIFNYLPKDPGMAWFEQPAGESQTLMLCRESGYLAGENCPDAVPAEAPRFMKPLPRCPYHQAVYLDSTETYQVCSLCWESGTYHRVSRLLYPPDVVQYLRGRGQVISDLPPHRPDCPGQNGQLAVQILYPQENTRIWLPRDFGGALQKVILRAAHRERDRQIYWYLDQRYLGSTANRHELAVELQEGWHQLEIVDETGQRDQKRFWVGRKE